MERDDAIPISAADELGGLSLPELEDLWAKEPVREIPPGVFVGRFLRFVDSAGARSPGLRLVSNVGFRWTPFGVDFSRRLWFFFTPAVAAGRFQPRRGPSRWRDTEAVGLHYQESKLPRFVRSWLYDEVKPLSADLCLGLGGVNEDRGRGDLFFFALQRMGGSP